MKKVEVPTTESFIPTIVDRRGCGHHSKNLGTPCWQMLGDSGQLLAGICNKRATKTGFVGKITPQSLSRGNGAPRFAKKK